LGHAVARWRRLGSLARLDGDDLAAVLLLGTLIVLVGLTFRDYAISPTTRKFSSVTAK
jgi:hypothetical protein